MQVPFFELKTQYRSIQAEINAAVERVLSSGQYILGPEVEGLEHAVAASCGAKTAVAVASGTDALILALRALNIGPGDEVITTAFSFFATAEAIALVGAIPVFCDIHADDYQIDEAYLESQISAKTRAIIPVHLYGQPCNMPAIMQIAQRHQLAVIEDCAQALGACIAGQPVGSFGDFAALSFYPTKNLGGCGDGGMVLARRERDAELLRLLRAHGSRERYSHEAIGYNSRLDEIQAAILRVKLPYLAAWNTARQAIAQRYSQAFSAYTHFLQVPPVHAEATSVYHLYTVRCAERARLMAGLTAAGVGYQVAYPSTLPDQAAFRNYPIRTGSCRQARLASQQVVSLPIYPELEEAQIAHVISTVSTLCGGRHPRG